MIADAIDLRKFQPRELHGFLVMRGVRLMRVAAFYPCRVQFVSQLLSGRKRARPAVWNRLYGAIREALAEREE